MSKIIVDHYTLMRLVNVLRKSLRAVDILQDHSEEIAKTLGIDLAIVRAVIEEHPEPYTIGLPDAHKLLSEMLTRAETDAKSKPQPTKASRAEEARAAEWRDYVSHIGTNGKNKEAATS